MKKELVLFEKTGAFSSFFMDYILQKPELLPFYSRYPAVENFRNQIEEKGKSYSPEIRKSLSEVLEKQYAGVEPAEPVLKNIQALGNDKTFTIVTGHQLNIFSGPLYFIYKIVSAINTCRALKQSYPEYHFVPVYWMASEDHDFEEISCFRLMDKKYCWKTTQTGAVGRMNLSELLPLISEIPGNTEPFATAYRSSQTLAEAVRKYVHALFGKDGLVVVDADDRELKSHFSPVMEADVLNGVPHQLAEETGKELRNAGYEPQVLVRPVNFFYLDKGVRERIEKSGNDFVVSEAGLKFSEKEIREIINQTPEKLSPNVILRPLYQETILPNLAYIGGPAEMVYWLQLKKVFEHFSTPFPVLMPRNFALVADAPSTRLLKKSGISLQELFSEKHILLNEVAKRNSSIPLTLEKQRAEFERLMISIREQAMAIDPTLSKMTDAGLHRIKQATEKIEHKMLRAEKRKGSDSIRQAETLKNKLFPGGGLQERTDNLLNFYQTDNQFIDHLAEAFDPFDFRFTVLLYE